VLFFHIYEFSRILFYSFASSIEVQDEREEPKTREITLKVHFMLCEMPGTG
jgi:hypothetical protein